MPTLRCLFFICCVLVLGSALQSCGYYNPYVARKDSRPITLYHSMWSNNTNEAGLQATFFQSLSGWLRKSRLIHIQEQADRAEYILSGSIDSVHYPETAFGSNKQATQLQADLVVSFTLTEQATGTIVWEKKHYTRSESFFLESSPQDTRSNRKAALETIADDISEEIYLHFINTIMRKPETQTTHY